GDGHVVRPAHGVRRSCLSGSRSAALHVRAHRQPRHHRTQRSHGRQPAPLPAAADRRRHAAHALAVRTLLRAFTPGWTALRRAVPGVLIAIALAALARGMAQQFAQGAVGLPKIPLSPVMCAVLLGMLWRNTLGVPSWATSGLNWTMHRLLRVG